MKIGMCSRHNFGGGGRSERGGGGLFLVPPAPSLFHLLCRLHEDIIESFRSRTRRLLGRGDRAKD